MPEGVADTILVKIDADIEGARRKLAQFEKEAEKRAKNIGRALSKASGPGDAAGRFPTGTPRRPARGDRLHVRTVRPTGENHDASRLGTIGAGLVVAGGFVSKAPPPVGALGEAAVIFGGALALSAGAIESMEKLEIKIGTLNDALETYRENLREVKVLAERATAGPVDSSGRITDFEALRQGQIVALAENQAIVSGLAATWERLAADLAHMRRFGGKLVDPAAERRIIGDIEAVQQALLDIWNMSADNEVIPHLLRLREFLARSAPSAPFFGEGGEPSGAGNGRVFGGAAGVDALFGGAGSDALGAPLRRLGRNVADTTRRFTALTVEAGRFEELGAPLAEALARNNALFGTQAERLRGLGEFMPELGHRLIDVFDETTEGAGRLDRAVATLGQRFLDAFEGAIRRGESLGDVLKALIRDLAGLALQQAKAGGVFEVGPRSAGGGLFGTLLGGLGGLFGGGFFTTGLGPQFAGTGALGLLSSGSFAMGGAFANGRALSVFARGGVLSNTVFDRPTLFPMARGAGLLGEAGPEAVLPLTRLASGELGVKTPAPPAPSAAPVHITINAPGADRGALQELTRELRRQGEYLHHLDRTMDRRAVAAVAWRRSRGGNIARALGGW